MLHNFIFVLRGKQHLWAIIELKGVTSRFPQPEKLSIDFSSLSFTIRVNLLHPYPSVFPYGLLLSLLCLLISVNYYFPVSFDVKVILYAVKITENAGAPLITRDR